MKRQLDMKRGPIVTPLPVLLVGTYDEDGTPNLMNVAWGGQCSERHVALNIGHVRKTRDNIERTHEFTVSFATADTVVPADYVGIVSGLKVKDKVARAGLHAQKAQTVNAPVFDEFPLTLECRLDEIVETKTEEIRITGEIVGMTADESILTEDGKVDLAKLRPIMFDSAQNKYRVIGDIVGNAFKDGLKLK